MTLTLLHNKPKSGRLLGKRAKPPAKLYVGPGRPLKFPDQLVEDMVKAGSPIKDIAAHLNCTNATVYNRIRKMGIDRPPLDQAESNQFSLQLVAEFSGHERIENIAKRHEISIGCTRNRLLRGVELLFDRPESKDSPLHWLPKPKILKEIKILNCLLRKQFLFDEPAKIMEITNLSEACVTKYLNRVVSK